MRSFADLFHELCRAGSVLGGSRFRIAGAEVNFAQFGLGSVVHAGGTARDVQAGISAQDGQAVDLAVVEIGPVFPPDTGVRAKEEPRPPAAGAQGGPAFRHRGSTGRFRRAAPAQDVPHR